MNDQTKKAIVHITQALNDFANTLPPSARGPFISTTQDDIKQIESELYKPKE